MKILFYVTLVCVTLYGCQSGAVDHQPVVKVDADRNAVRFTPIATPARMKIELDALSNNERNMYRDAQAEAIAPFRDAYYTGATAAELEVLAEKVIESQQNNPYLYHMEQRVSGLMLELWLQEDTYSIETVARHTQRLLENEYPDARALVSALEALRGTWSSDQLRAAAEQVQRQARKPVLGKQCDGCTTPALERAQTQEQRDAVMTFDEAQTVALDRLAQLGF